MSWTTWWLFACATALIAATPGPNMLHIMTQSARLGLRRSTIAMAGCLTAVMICVTVSALGLGALLTASRTLFEGLRTIGVAYLLWLAWKSWTADAEGAIGNHPDATAVGGSAWAIYRTALFTGLSNPKLIVFATAFFPQFIRAERAWLPQFAILVATFAAIEVGCYIGYALGGRHIARYLSSATRQRAFNRVTGGLFAAFGLGLLAWRA